MKTLKLVVVVLTIFVCITEAQQRTKVCTKNTVNTPLVTVSKQTCVTKKTIETTTCVSVGGAIHGFGGSREGCVTERTTNNISKNNSATNQNSNIRNNALYNSSNNIQTINNIRNNTTRNSNTGSRKTR